MRTLLDIQFAQLVLSEAKARSLKSELEGLIWHLNCFSLNLVKFYSLRKTTYPFAVKLVIFFVLAMN